MELDNHVFIPREDFFALQAAAAEPPTATERVANTAQGLVIFAGLGAVAVATFTGICYAADWVEQKREDRQDRRKNRKLSSVKTS